MLSGGPLLAATQALGIRSEQEDRFALLSYGRGGHVCILADGMGGEVAGGTAARIAVDAALDALRPGDANASDAFVTALDAANTAIRRHLATNPGHAGMGTTLILLHVHGRMVRWLSVGDSPLYVWSAGRLKRLNADHSMAPMLDAAARRGDITVQEAMASPSRNVLMSAVTGDTVDRVDQRTEWLTLATGDWIIAASDGIETLSAAEIETVIGQAPSVPAEAMCSRLRDAVLSRRDPAQDNLTIVVACIVPFDEGPGLAGVTRRIA
ncbi:MAG: protein phosphatase 2C domain-containing protein [Rhizobiaceae bacterium]|jgi:serine/threonine protein phosphatase PrpC|nr:protein phosphatase 2C domain-containing protein [Rhizobiaceae bacterium]